MGLIVAGTGAFAIPSRLPGVEQNGIALAEEESSPSSPSLREKPVGTYAVVNGEVIPIREGMVLGKAGSFKGPIVLCGKGDDFYNRIEIGIKNVDGEIVVTKAKIKHVEEDNNSSLYNIMESIKAKAPLGDYVIQVRRGDPQASSQTYRLTGVEYEGWASTWLYRYGNWQTVTHCAMTYSDDGEKVEGHDPNWLWSWKEPEWSLKSHQDLWYPDGPDRVWILERAEFENDFDHAAACNFDGYSGTYEISGYVYPGPTPPYEEEIEGGREEV